MRFIFALAISIAACTATNVHAQQTLHLTLQGPPGEYISAGQSWDVTYTNFNTAFFNVSLQAQNGAALPNYVTFSAMQLPVSTNYLVAQFGTNMIGQPLAPGTYLDAQRAPFASPGHPGLDISFQHRGCNTLTGSFVINSIQYHQSGSSWILDHFDASFIQYCEGGSLAATGTITYNLPGCGTLTVIVAGLTGCTRRRRGS